MRYDHIFHLYQGSAAARVSVLSLARERELHGIAGKTSTTTLHDSLCCRLAHTYPKEQVLKEDDIFV